MNVLQNERDVETPKNICELYIQPFAVSNLDRKPMLTRKRFQEWEQTVGECVAILYLKFIEVRKLKHHDSELVSENAHRFNKCFKLFRTIDENFLVRDRLRHLDREN